VVEENDNMNKGGFSWSRLLGVSAARPGLVEKLVFLLLSQGDSRKLEGLYQVVVV